MIRHLTLSVEKYISEGRIHLLAHIERTVAICGSIYIQSTSIISKSGVVAQFHNDRIWIFHYVLSNICVLYATGIII